MDGQDRATRVAGVVLAAGAGTRLGLPKALLRVGDELLLDRAVRTLRHAGVHRSSSSSAPGLRTPWPPSTARASRWSRTLTGSRGWARPCAPRCTAWTAAPTPPVVSLVDQPGMTAATVERLVAAWRADGRAAVATYGGAPRNPVLLPAATWAQVAASAVGDRGARALAARASRPGQRGRLRRRRVGRRHRHPGRPAPVHHRLTCWRRRPTLARLRPMSPSGSKSPSVELEVDDRDGAGLQPGPGLLPGARRDQARPGRLLPRRRRRASSTRCASGRACCTASPTGVTGEKVHQKRLPARRAAVGRDGARALPALRTAPPTSCASPSSPA